MFLFFKMSEDSAGCVTRTETYTEPDTEWVLISP